MNGRVCRGLIGVLGGVVVAACVAPALASAYPAGTLMYNVCGDGQASILNWYLPSLGYSEGVTCPPGSYQDGEQGVWLFSNGNAPAGYVAHWEADPPPNISLTQVQVPKLVWTSYAADTGAFFYWPGGNSGYLTNNNDLGVSADTTQSWPADGSFYTFPAPERYFGWELACNAATECGNPAYFDVESLMFTAAETASPALHADGASNLWYQGGKWVRGAFPIQLDAEDDSGVCQAAISWDGQLQGDPTTATVPNQDAGWNQCDPGAAPDATQYFFAGDSINTAALVPTSKANVPLAIEASNAAYNQTYYQEEVNVDNLPVGLTLSGPTSASTTAGTQYITAHATAGPSGVTIGCSVDGGATRWQAGATALIPVAGAGLHTVSCQAHNGAVNAQGVWAYSPRESWSLNIGQPTVSAVGFSKIVDALKCRSVRQRVKVPAAWVTIRRHGKPVKVRRPAYTTTVKARRCHARIVWHKQTVMVKIRKHGKLVKIKRTRWVRVVLAPHTVTESKKLVAFGHGATVSGWVGTTAGVALAGVHVDIMVAPNNGENQFELADVAPTAADGSWSAKLSPGPSRLIEAVYPGAAGLLGAGSAVVELNVPARIRLSASPKELPWSGVVTLRGQLEGGYIPPDGVALRLLIKLTGRKKPYEPVPFRTNSHGSFVIRWSWKKGTGKATYPFAVATTATETDYPFAASASKPIKITFGVPQPKQKRRASR